jgi:hypothetical protein
MIPEISLSLPDLPDDNLAYPVLLMTKQGISGSGFFHDKDDVIYLITARHVLFKETSIHVPQQFVAPAPLRHKFSCDENKMKEDGKEKIDFLLTFYGVMSKSERDELMAASPKSVTFNFHKAIDQLYRESQNLLLRSNEITVLSYIPKCAGSSGINEFDVILTTMFKNGNVKYHKTQDVAFIKIGMLQKVNQENKVVLSKGVTLKQGKGLIGLGQDTFKLLNDVIVGNQVFVFGYPTSITSIDPWLDIKLPLLRKGIIAGKNESLKAIVLDCPAFYGNSGGLVIEAEHVTFSDTKYMAIGLITNYVPFKINWFQNSGYSIVVPMDFVEELITDQTK